MLIFDSTPLIYLAKAEMIEKLEEIEYEKIIPRNVYDEVVEEGKEKGVADAGRIERAIKKGVFEVESSNKDIDEDKKFLTEADLEVLALADQKNAIAVMDEEYGRNIAEVKGIKTRGTAFLVLRMLKKEIISEREAKNTVEKMIDDGWYCSTQLYKDIMKKIEEI